VELACEATQRRQMWVAWTSGVAGTWLPAVHANCAHNEIAALALRSLGPTPHPADAPLGGELRRQFGLLCRVARAYDGQRWSYLETAKSYSGSLRRRYIDAEASLREDGPISSRDVLLRAFVKAEKLGSQKDAKPRMIFPRSPRYNLCVASFLKPFEHWLWGYLTARRVFGGSNTRVVGKGLSPKRRANLIVRKFGEFRDCVCFEADGKAFEAHVSQGQLEGERSVYLAAYSGNKELADLLSRQVFRGVTPSGAKFHRPGGRASGDFNTGMGNTLIMLATLCAALSPLSIKFDLLVDGDNALVFLERADAGPVIHNFAQRVLDLSGHEMTLEKPVSYIEGVRFGRSAPVFLGRGLGWTMCREPESVLSGAYASHRWLREPVFGRRWLNGVARCELSLARGMPVLQEAALSVLKQTEHRKKVPVDALSDYFVVGAWLAEEEDVIPVSLDARLSFERAFGWSAERQVAAEESFPNRLVQFPAVVQEMPPPSRWVEADPGLYEVYWDAHI